MVTFRVRLQYAPVGAMLWTVVGENFGPPFDPITVPVVITTEYQSELRMKVMISGSGVPVTERETIMISPQDRGEYVYDWAANWLHQVGYIPDDVGPVVSPEPASKCPPGYAVCERCDGKGLVRCPLCKTEEALQCTICNGAGCVLIRRNIVVRTCQRCVNAFR